MTVFKWKEEGMISVSVVGKTRSDGHKLQKKNRKQEKTNKLTKQTQKH